MSFAKLTMNAAIGIDDATYALRRRHLLHRLFHFRGAVEPDSRARRRPALDRAHHDHLGARFRGHGVVTGPTVHVMRFLLGLAEAGFFPGILLYLTYWFPAYDARRSSACSWSRARVRSDRQSAVWRADADQRSRPRRLAMDVHPRRDSRRGARPGLPRVPAGSATRCDVAQGRRTRMAHRRRLQPNAAWSRQRGLRHCAPL